MAGRMVIKTSVILSFFLFVLIFCSGGPKKGNTGGDPDDIPAREYDSTFLFNGNQLRLLNLL